MLVSGRVTNTALDIQRKGGCLGWSCQAWDYKKVSLNGPQVEKMSGMSWKFKNASIFLGEPTGLIDDQTKDMYVSKYTECFLFLSHAKIIWHICPCACIDPCTNMSGAKKNHHKFMVIEKKQWQSLHIRITTSCFFLVRTVGLKSFGFQI